MSKDNQYPKMLYRAGEPKKGTNDVAVLVHVGQDPVHYRIASDADAEKALAKEGFSADFSKPGKVPAKTEKTEKVEK
jgi:hypothetical protein